ncbi:MAG: GNAT family N-acetyltransferase [Planctomycetota bacterium]
MDPAPLSLRRLRPSDSLEALTSLLREAYASLAAQGLHYVASRQTVEITRRRLEGGECWVGEHEGRLVATYTLYPPGTGEGPEWYARPDVAKVGQLAVHPDRKGDGLGARLMDHAEDRARALGAREVAVDTAESAEDLIRWYASRGYRHVGTYDWRPHTNYLSVVMSLRL